MYDARSRTASIDGNVVFAAAAVLVVALAFAAAWFGTDLLANRSASAAEPPQTEISESPPAGALAAFSSRTEQRYLKAIQRLHPQAVRDLEADIASGHLDEAGRQRALQEASARAVLDNLDHLAHVRTADLNKMLDTTITHLRRARQSRSKLCEGSFLAQFEGVSPKRAEAMMRRAGITEAAFAQYGMEIGADMLDMLEHARRNPARHGKLNRKDEAALQGLMMSLMSDPKIMQLAMAGNEPSALRDVDVCSLGISLLSAVDTLPDETKGRAWAAMFDQPEVRRALKQAEGFRF